MELRQPPSIDAFGGGGFRVGGERLQGSILILGDVARPWAPRVLRDLVLSDFEDVLAGDAEQVEFVLLGVGSAMGLAPRAVREGLAARGVGLELMTTPEACRLYNVLASDGRRIAAALLVL